MSEEQSPPKDLQDLDDIHTRIMNRLAQDGGVLPVKRREAYKQWAKTQDPGQHNYDDDTPLTKTIQPLMAIKRRLENDINSDLVAADSDRVYNRIVEKLRVDAILITPEKDQQL